MSYCIFNQQRQPGRWNKEYRHIANALTLAHVLIHIDEMMRHYFLYIYFLIIVSCTDQDNNEIKEAKSDSLLIVASQTDSLIVENPQSVSKKIPLDDSSYFRIKISSDNKYTISFYPDSLVSAQISLVDSFISNHINRIAQEKILVTVDRNAKKEMVKDLNNLFRKYKIYKFRITTIPDVY